MTIQERYEEYSSKWEELKNYKEKSFNEYLKYCENNKSLIPRPIYKNYYFDKEYEMSALFHKMEALKEFI